MYEITGKLLILKYPLRLSHTLSKGVYYIMKEIQLGRQGKNKGKHVALVDDEDFEYLSQWNWSVMKRRNTFYACRNVIVDGGRTKVLMHCVIMSGKNIDHRDHNGCNNTRSNLRFCTVSENGMNRIKHAGTSSIYKGVSFFKRDSNWTAQIQINGKPIRLGTFDTEVDAAKAYNAKAIELFCEFANLNIIN